MRANIGDSRGFWIGLADMEEEGVYLWQHSLQVLDADEFHAWGTGQPDDSPQENCVATTEEHYFFW